MSDTQHERDVLLACRKSSHLSQLGQTHSAQVQSSSSQHLQPASQTPHSHPALATSLLTDANSVADAAVADAGHVPPLAQQLGTASAFITNVVAASHPQASQAHELHVQSSPSQQPQPASHWPHGHVAAAAVECGHLPSQFITDEEADATSARAT
ncbi:hypothetical protein [Rubripirellula reticaptiva]|uniref:hypothetical protein n=1 Tax=Rubripirellula reticaptiva TaxID=2528013 RepID=UPI0011B6870E|nr:hypothetical protein [Rubripirellula reticaptiva]